MDILEELNRRGLEATPENVELVFKEQLLREHNKNVQEVKSLLGKGISKRDILLMEKYSFKVLNEAGVGITALVPDKKPKDVSEDWGYSIPNEGKFEYFDKTCFGSEDGRDSLLICLLANMGLNHFVEILPEESKNILKDILNTKED